MSNHRFDGRVAVVTGAGRGIGRSYARLLGALGASVVVNDLGGTTAGVGRDRGPAQSVADEITNAGGTAISDASDVSTAEGGQSLIDAAVDAFERIDVLVNNAGNIIHGRLPQVDLDNIESHLAVHVKGSFNTTRAAWPHMVKQNYGRVVLTGSTGMFGLLDNLGYAIAKSAMIGMAHSLTVSAAGSDIKINVIAPNANTRMGKVPSEGLRAIRQPGVAAPQPDLDPDFVAPMVAYLAHESCPVSGEVYVAGGGRFARIFVAATDGHLDPDPAKVTVDDVAEHWATINNPTDYYIPTSLRDWATRFMAHRA